MARFAIAPGVTFLDRTGWGAVDELPRLGFFVPRGWRSHVILHHTVIVDPDKTMNLWEDEAEVTRKMRQLQRIRPDLGFDVPYNFVIFLMATEPASIYVCEGRGEDRSGTHTKGHNTTGLGVALQGNFEIETDLTPFVPLISLFLGWLKFDPNGPSYGGPYEPLKNLGTFSPSGRRWVFVHSDFRPTLCPGRSVLLVMSRFRFQDPRSPNQAAVRYHA